MAMAGVKVEIISRETIRPSSPTPPHLRTYKLSFLDQLSIRLYMPIILFYSNDSRDIPSKPAAERSRWLKDSLSETLTRYYPFAGRFTDNVSIDCNDEGVDFWEAKIKCQASEILAKIDAAETLNILFPVGFLWKDSCKGSLIGIQVNFFDCGGMAITMCISHKIADGSTIATFLKDWATIAAQSGEQVSPKFIATSILDLPGINNNFVVPEIELGKGNCVTRRFVFEAPKISHLKAMAGIPNPTKVEVVISLLYKCALAVSKEKLSSLRSSLLIQMVNMRPRMDPPLPTNSAGNFTWYLTVSAKKEEESEIKLHELVGELRNGITQLCDKEKNNLNANEWLLEVVESMKEVKVLFDDLDVYRCSSFCKFPLYQVDFGWGKPLWVSMANGMVKNVIVLMDTQKGDGIEAHVTLEEQDMAIFQSQQELLEFAYLNPLALF